MPEATSVSLGEIPHYYQASRGREPELRSRRFGRGRSLEAV